MSNIFCRDGPIQHRSSLGAGKGVAVISRANKHYTSNGRNEQASHTRTSVHFPKMTPFRSRRLVAQARYHNTMLFVMGQGARAGLRLVLAYSPSRRLLEHGVL